MKQVLLIGGLILLGLIIVPIITNNMQSAKLKSEIERVASKSNIKPTSINCGNAELAQICYAEYSSVSSAQLKQMLLSNGYVLVDEQYDQGDDISATNQSTEVRVDSKSGSTQILKFKDINVTL